VQKIGIIIKRLTKNTKLYLPIYLQRKCGSGRYDYRNVEANLTELLGCAFGSCFAGDSLLWNSVLFYSIKIRFIDQKHLHKGKKIKGEAHPRTGHEDQEGSRGISALGGGGWSTPRPGCFFSGRKRGTRCTGG